MILVAGDQLKTAAALIELDGRARRIVLCPPDLEARHLAAVARDAAADAVVYDAQSQPPREIDVAVAAPCALPLRSTPGRARRTARDRMGVADLGNHRRSENGASTRWRR